MSPQMRHVDAETAIDRNRSKTRRVVTGLVPAPTIPGCKGRGGRAVPNYRDGWNKPGTTKWELPRGFVPLTLDFCIASGIQPLRRGRIPQHNLRRIR
jgi:hypothetical protein